MIITRNSPIAVLDSGIGGLSLLKSLTAKYPNENYIYLADNLNMPYGNKSARFLNKRVLQLVTFLHENYNIKLAILACHTASSVSLRDINKSSPVKVLGLDLSKYNSTILATKLTAKAYPNAKALPSLASKVEENYFDKTTLVRKVKLIKHNLSGNIVLGCTHYELIASIFKEVYPNTNFILPCKDWVEEFTLDKPAQNSKGSVLMISATPTKSYIDKLWKIYND